MEEKSIDVLLEDEIAFRLEELNGLPLDSEEYGKACESIERLYRLRTEKLKNSIGDKNSKRELIGNVVNIGVSTAIAGASFLFKNKWLKRGFIFEEKGSISSELTRSLMSGITKFKK